jgi:hypothetical protein
VQAPKRSAGPWALPTDISAHQERFLLSTPYLYPKAHTLTMQFLRGLMRSTERTIRLFFLELSWAAGGLQLGITVGLKPVMFNIFRLT